MLKVVTQYSYFKNEEIYSTFLLPKIWLTQSIYLYRAKGRKVEQKWNIGPTCLGRAERAQRAVVR